MTIQSGHSAHACDDFEKEVEKEGCAVFSKAKSRSPGYYPSPFPNNEDIELDALHVGDTVTIRVFFKAGTGRKYRIEGGLVDAEIEAIEGKTIWANILTELPKGFPLQKSTTIGLSIDEVLELAHC
jgi:hypothetical protein